MCWCHKGLYYTVSFKDFPFPDVIIRVRALAKCVYVFALRVNTFSMYWFGMTAIRAYHEIMYTPTHKTIANVLRTLANSYSKIITRPGESHDCCCCCCFCSFVSHICRIVPYAKLDEAHTDPIQALSVHYIERFP